VKNAIRAAFTASQHRVNEHIQRSLARILAQASSGPS
jgi:hypothetical protein